MSGGGAERFGGDGGMVRTLFDTLKAGQVNPGQNNSGQQNPFSGLRDEFVQNLSNVFGDSTLNRLQQNPLFEDSIRGSLGYKPEQGAFPHVQMPEIYQNEFGNPHRGAVGSAFGAHILPAPHNPEFEQDFMADLENAGGATGPGPAGKPGERVTVYQDLETDGGRQYSRPIGYYTVPQAAAPVDTKS